MMQANQTYSIHNLQMNQGACCSCLPLSFWNIYQLYEKLCCFFMRKQNQAKGALDLLTVLNLNVMQRAGLAVISVSYVNGNVECSLKALNLKLNPKAQAEDNYCGKCYVCRLCRLTKRFHLEVVECHVYVKFGGGAVVSWRPGQVSHPNEGRRLAALEESLLTCCVLTIHNHIACGMPEKLLFPEVFS